MSGEPPKLISAPISFSQGVARTDMKTWGVLAILLVVAISVVFVFGLFHKKEPMFGNLPFGQAPPQAQPERLREIPIAPPGSVPKPRPPG